jgi:hypothetical protein
VDQPPHDGHRLLTGLLLQVLAVPVMAEDYVGQLLDRDEFRRHCDREAILANLP